MTREEAIKDVYDTSTKTNINVNINPDTGIVATTWKTGERMLKKYRKDD